MKKMWLFLFMFALAGCQASKRHVVNNTFISDSSPAVEISVAESFTYLGEKDWSFKGNLDNYSFKVKTKTYTFAKFGIDGDVDTLVFIRYFKLPKDFTFKSDVFIDLSCLDRGFYTIDNTEYHKAVIIDTLGSDDIAAQIEESRHIAPNDFLALVIGKATRGDKVLFYYGKPYDKRLNFGNGIISTISDAEFVAQLRNGFKNDIAIRSLQGN